MLRTGASTKFGIFGSQTNFAFLYPFCGTGEAAKPANRLLCFVGGEGVTLGRARWNSGFESRISKSRVNLDALSVCS